MDDTIWLVSGGESLLNRGNFLLWKVEYEELAKKEAPSSAERLGEKGKIIAIAYMTDKVKLKSIQSMTNIV